MLHEIFIATVVAIILLFAKELWWIFSGYFNKLFNDLPDLTGTWNATHQEIDENGVFVTTTEKVTFKQAGRLIWGTLRNNTPDQDEYKFSGHIIGTTIIAKSWGKEKQRAVGSCAFILKVHNNGNSMVGHCTWHDFHSDIVESSSYTWVRD